MRTFASQVEKVASALGLQLRLDGDDLWQIWNWAMSGRGGALWPGGAGIWANVGDPRELTAAAARSHARAFEETCDVGVECIAGEACFLGRLGLCFAVIIIINAFWAVLLGFEDVLP